MLEYKFDTQLLIEGENLSEDDINDISPITLKETVSLPLATRN